MSHIYTSVFLAPRENINYVYGDEREQAICQRTRPVGPSVEPRELDEEHPRLLDAEVVFSTWGMPQLTADQIERDMPSVKAVFYAAGSVQGFARPFLERGVRVVSAWRSNAVAVAHFTVAQIVLSSKGYFRNLREYDGSSNSYRDAFRGRGGYGETIGIMGAGAIGKLVIEMLAAFDFHILVWDPFLTADDAAKLGAEKADTLAELFAQSYIVSNHVADNAQTVGLLPGSLFESMRTDATFINTGRGRTVDETGLIDAMRKRADLTALLDVTHPEPSGANAPVMDLPNVHVTTHIAGAINDEVRRMADLCILEFDRFASGQPLHHEVCAEQLETMA